MTDAFRKQSEADLDSFLRLRAREFALNGLLLVIVPGTLGDSCVGDGLFSCLWDAAAELAGRERIDASLLEDLIMPVYFMTEDVGSPALPGHQQLLAGVWTAFTRLCSLEQPHAPEHGYADTHTRGVGAARLMREYADPGDGGISAQVGLLGGAAARRRFPDAGRPTQSFYAHTSNCLMHGRQQLSYTLDSTTTGCRKVQSHARRGFALAMQMWDAYKAGEDAGAYARTMLKILRAITEPVMRNRLALNDQTTEVSLFCNTLACISAVRL